MVIFKHKGKDFQKEQILANLSEIIRRTVIDTKTDTLNWINVFVPKRTGLLRDDLIDWITREWIFSTNDVHITLGTTVPYASKITGDVQHFGTWFEHSGAPAYIYLDDPQALINWKEAISNYITQQWELNIYINKINIMGM